MFNLYNVVYNSKRNMRGLITNTDKNGNRPLYFVKYVNDCTMAWEKPKNLKKV